MAAVILSSAFQDAQQSLPQQITRSDLITAKTTGVEDAEHIDVSGAVTSHLVRPLPSYRTSSLAYDTWVDIEPKSGGSSFGSTVKFNFGLEGHALLTKVEVHFVLGDISLTAGTAEGDRDETVFPAYLAERLLGEEYDVKLQQERVERVNTDCMHWERMLMMDTANSEREGYEQSVSVIESSKGRHCWVPLRLPYGRDQPLIALAFAEEHQLSFTIPTWANIRRYRGRALSGDVSGSAALADAPSISCFLRLHYTEVDQPSRAMFATQMVQQGLRYHMSILEKDVDDEYTITSVSGNDVKTRNSSWNVIHPAALCVAVVRNAKDLLAAVDLPVAFTSVTAAHISDGSATTYNPCPDRYNALIPIYWELRENLQRVLPRFSWKYYNSALHPKLFPSENFVPAAVVCHTPHPTLAHKHSLGHLTYSNMNNPSLLVAFRCMNVDDGDADALGNVPAELEIWSRELEAGLDVPAASALNSVTQIDINILKFIIAPNFLVLAASRIWQAYN